MVNNEFIGLYNKHCFKSHLQKSN